MSMHVEKVSRRLTGWLVRKNTIGCEDREIYEYGIFQLLVNTWYMLSILLLSLAFGLPAEGLLFACCFCILRQYTGGMHAGSLTGCYLMTLGAALASLLLLRFVKLPITAMCLIWIFDGIVIFKMAPVEHRNKPLEDRECVVYRRRSIVLWALEGILMFLMLSLHFEMLSESILLGNMLCVISMGAAKFAARKG